LESLGQEVRVCYDAASALATARADIPDIIFSDIAMPQVDGYQLAHQVRSDPLFDRVVLIALTGYGEDSDRQLAREAGFQHHLVKPVSIQSLESVLLAVGN
jgi:CheY-like chemotaxis protein